MTDFSVTQDGKPLNKSLYTWDKKTRTLSTKENNLVLDFSGLSSCTFKTGNDCTFKAGSCCTFKTGHNCTFDTGPYCAFKTGSYCIFDTGYDCTFVTGIGCTFDTGYNCIFKTGEKCVVIRRNFFEVIKLAKDITTQLAPYKISGYVKNGYYHKNGKKQYKAIIADGILSEIIKQRGNVYKIKNHGQNEITYLVKDGDIYSHGKTLQEAKESLIYKISNRATSKYKDYDLNTEVSKKDAIQMYRCITGACEQGTKMFVESLKNVPESLTVQEIIEITKGQYGNDKFREFFRKGE